MIIECPKCGTKFRFDEHIALKKGIWARCSRCQHVFYREKLTPENAELGLSEEKNRSYFGGNAAREATEDPDSEPDQDEAISMPRRTRRNLWTPGKVAAYIFILIIVLGGVYVSIFPEVGKHLLGKTPLAQFFGMKVAPAGLDGGGIDLLNVQERFIDNRMIGSIMVIQGFAVNKNKYPVSKIKVRAKLLNASGEFIGESDSFCGNLLSEADLVNLTEREIRQELGNPLGKNTPNANIPQDGNIPFMVIFINSPPKAAEYIVELAELEKPLR
jgi:predicted Zn finger-like uncharacterized protein